MREIASYLDLHDELREIDRCMDRFLRDSIQRLDSLAVDSLAAGGEARAVCEANLCVRRAQCDVLMAFSRIAEAAGSAGDDAE